MTSAEQAAIAHRLRIALQDAGISVERSQESRGNLVGWYEVPPEAIVGYWLQRGWKVSLR